MIIADDRSSFDGACADNRATILVLSGSKESPAGVIHNCMEEGGWEPWYRWFLFTRLDVLTNDERNSWFGGGNPERYAVLGGRSPKTVAATGDVAALLLPDSSECDTLTIMEELAKGDAL